MSNINEFEPITLERILSHGTMVEAIKRVIANKGGAGVDGMKTGEILEYIRSHPYEISESVRKGTYRPKPIKRVYIPKDNGDKRPLGIPTVIDRFIQQSIALVLSEEYEKIFSDNSFGFRPGRGCRNAIDRATEYVNSGLEWVIDLDLSKFFDTVNHSKLLQLLSDRIADGRVISLIHRFLRAPISEDGKVGKKNTIGTPQGGVISPVLANVLLNELDQLLDSRGIKFVRYADDMVIFCGSKKAAERILANVTSFIEKKLFLKVNTDKTKILHACEETQFLGFAFTTRVSAKRRKEHPTWKFFPIVHKKKRLKLVESLKTTLDRRAKGGIDVVKRRLLLKLRGWCNYFEGAIPRSWMEDTDAWIRRRVRQLLWKQWKKPSKRKEEYTKRVKYVSITDADSFSTNRYWNMARSQLLHRMLPNMVLAWEGWVCIGTFARCASD
ncbi:MAG: group II intron reverse transcriptase/maturase [Succinivibrionaceae bacterium]|nr:group II intron reverse transcriptase/maturase [Succinivibrionaceae bacterium]